ncbi:hypothetical protein ACFLYC_02360 [Chloroflexota bacterium]
MKRNQTGQALILVLVVLAIGAMLVVPSLRLTSTAFMGTPIVEGQTKGLYAADAATEYILWKLAYDNLGQDFSEDGQSAYFAFNVCDIPVSATVIMRAMEGQGGVTLATEDVIQPTKIVEVEGHPEWNTPDGGVEVANGYPGPYTYIITLEQLSSDNSKGLDSIYEIVPKGLTYIPGTSQIRVDGGVWTDDIGEPSVYITGGQSRLRWPPAPGFFTSPMRDFDVRQVKEIKFQATGSLQNDRLFYNWVLLNVEDIDTLSGPVAPIKLGSGATKVGGMLNVTKTSDPEIIQPGVETDIEYTISITNLDESTKQVQNITDYLPPGFEYLGPTTGLTSDEPQITLETINGVDRYKLYWEFSPAVAIAEDETVYMVFMATATKDVSGSYYNEFVVVPNESVPGIFQPSDMDVTHEDFNSTYSWNQGAVIVPAYDTSSEAEGITIDSNMSLILGGITITSWKVH